jgi:hypothetical protein
MSPTRSICDDTQRFYCAVLVYRNYFIKQENGTIGQLAKEVELFGRTPIGGYVKHGYPILTQRVLAQLQTHDWSNTRQFYDGLRENCESTAGPALCVSNRQTGQIVRHVYVAAFNFNGAVQRNNRSLEIGRQMLAAEYQATVLTAWEILSSSARIAMPLNCFFASNTSA